jgi:hypothetical protein
VLLLDEIHAVDHGLVVDSGETRDDLHEEVQLRVSTFVVV